MKITIETKEKTEISSQTTAAAEVVAPMDGSASPAVLEGIETQATMPTLSVARTGAVDAGQPPSWLVEAIEGAASSKPATSQETADAGSGPSQ